MDAKQSAQMLTEQARFSRICKMILQTILIKFNELGEEVLHFSKTPEGQYLSSSCQLYEEETTVC